MTQKFHKGDLVHVAADLGDYMSHFPKDIDAIVIGSYRDQFGSGSETSYTLHLKGRGQCSWYEEQHLTLIKHGAGEVLWQWQRDEAELAARHSNLDWIFQHGPELIENCPGATVAKLAEVLGCTNLWGTHGEGISWHTNARMTLAVAKPYLEAKNKHGFLRLAASKPNIHWVDYKVC